MVRGKGIQTRELLTPAERESLMGERRELEDALKDKKGYGIGTQAEQIDEAKLQQQIRRIDLAIANREPPKLTGTDRDKMSKEVDELQGALEAGLPTRDEMDHPAKNPGAVRKHMRWLERNAANIERWRYIQRVLNPDDPKSIENLRKEK